jgi:hypothetical protein
MMFLFSVCLFLFLDETKEFKASPKGKRDGDKGKAKGKTSGDLCNCFHDGVGLGGRIKAAF